jgi:hypothetical protein
MSDAIVIALIGLGSAALGGIITALLTRKKTKAEASQIVMDMAMKLLDKETEVWNKRLSALERLTEQQEKELELLRPLPAIVETMSRGIHILIEQIRGWGETPKWTPSDMEPVVKRKKG